VDDRTVIAVFVLSFAFFWGELTNEQQVWVTPDRTVIAVFVLAFDFVFLVLSLVFLRPCGRWSGLRLFLVAFYSFVTCIFLISAHETIFLLYLLSCFFHRLPSRKLFSCGNTRFGRSLFTSFMLAVVLPQIALLRNAVLSMSQSSCGS